MQHDRRPIAIASVHTSPVAMVTAMACATLLLVTASWANVSPVRAAEAAPSEWQPVVLPDRTERVTLEPSEQDVDGIPTDATFTLTSLTDVPAAELLPGLRVDPEIDLDADDALGPSTLALHPVTELIPGQRYHFELRGRDEGLIGSWVFRTQAPLQVIGTLPRHQAGWVPQDTGIEVTFDRDGLVAPDRHFVIEPPVKGRFEIRGDTLSFIPKRKLPPATLFTVSIEPGLRVEGSDARLDERYAFSFRTRPGKGQGGEATRFTTEVAESAPDQPPSLEVWVPRGSPDEMEVRIHRFRDLEDVIRAMSSVQGTPPWTEPSRLSMPTDGLRSMGTATGTLRRVDGWDPSRRSLTLPDPLPRGWYLVSIPAKGTKGGADAQAIVQVTDLAAYAHVSRTDSLFWVNSLAEKGPVDGATVSLVGGPVLGSTDADGVLVLPTTDALVSSEPVPLVMVRTDESAVLLPFGLGAPWDSPNVERGWDDPSLSDRMWSYMALDRYAYRSTDSINAWGMVRSRDDGSVPSSVELRLYATDEDDDGVGGRPSLATATAAPSATGVFSASVAYEDLPIGDYIFEATVDDELVRREWLNIDSIIKPAYRLVAETDRRAYMEGEPIDLALQASFFDGTSVPSAPLIVSTRGSRRSPVTDSQGNARVTLPAVHRSSDQIAFQRLNARPKRAEEGEISAGATVVVMGSSVFISGEATVEDGRMLLEGAVNEVDFDRLEQRLADVPGREDEFDSELDPRGRPLAGVEVTAEVFESVPVRKKTGTVYDFIAKKVIPVFEWRSRRTDAGTRDLVTSGDGTFSLRVDGDEGSTFEIILTATDAEGRRARQHVYAETPYRESRGARPYLSFADRARDTFDPRRLMSVGERTTVELRQGRGRQPSGGPNRYLFLIQQGGLREPILQDAPTLDLTFTEDDVPSMDVGAVRFTGDSYVAVPDGLTLQLDAQDRALGLEISAAEERYAPGDTVDLTLRTTDHDGRPVPASVVIHAIDEKLYAMGLAGIADPLPEIYQVVSSGLVRSYASHQQPGSSMRQGGFGDTAGGGGARSDFRDVLLFRQVETDETGTASLDFGTSDDLTSWRIAAAGVSDGIDVGVQTALVSVGLPFFVEVVAADDYLVGDEVRLMLRAFGSSLDAGDPVSFSVSAPSLGLEETSLEGVAFRGVEVALPPLVEGEHAITVEGSASVDGQDVHDALVRTIEILPSRLVRRRTEHATLEPGVELPGGDSLTNVVISDLGRGRFYPQLMDLASASGPRADESLAGIEARHLLEHWFAGADQSLPEAAFDSTHFQRSNGSIALLPFGGTDEELSFLVALAAPDSVDAPRLAGWFRELQGQRKTSRERALRAAAARAALGDDVLEDLDSIASESPLSPSDSLVYALGLAAAGDHLAARAIERELLAEHGQQLGEWIRLRLPEGPGTSESSARTARMRAERIARETALFAILAASLGDQDVAVAADAYVRENPPDEWVGALQQVAVIDRLIEGSGGEPASFVMTIEDEHRTIDLDPGAAYRMTLSGPQRASIGLAPVQGSLGIASSWSEPLEVEASGQPGGISIQRSVRPEGTIDAVDTAEITLRVRLGDDAVDGCYLVTDMAPSGLAPLRDAAGWPKRRRGESEPSRIIGPLSITGQRVDFCVYPDKKRPVQTLRYHGRVVTPGTYVWEPTLVQSTRVPGLQQLGTAAAIRLDGAGGDPLGGDPGLGTGDGADAGAVTDSELGSRAALEDALAGRLAPVECQRWRQDDQPFGFGATAAVQCDQPAPGLAQLALFVFPDDGSLQDFWAWRLDQVDAGRKERAGACADGRPGVASFDGGELLCYRSGAGAGVAKIRWIDEASRTYGVADATHRDIAKLHGWWSTDRP